MAGLIGRKLGMTSIFDEERRSIACTVIEAGPCVVTQVKTAAKDGYDAVQIGFGEKRDKHTTKAMKTHFEKANTTSKRILKEFTGYPSAYKAGDAITVELFQPGEWVDVSGTSKGKGFQGVVKLHGFAGVGGQTHGQHNRGRAPGSMGPGSTPARIFKGKRMAGRMGGNTVKLQNLKVIKVVREKNLILISGNVPGRKGSFVVIEK